VPLSLLLVTDLERLSIILGHIRMS
jgi:hypothetical protein